MAETNTTKELTLADVIEQMTQQSLLIEGLQKQNLELEAKQVKTGIGANPVELPSIPTELVEIGGEKYKWQVAQFHRHDHGPMTAKEASTDEEILEEIIAIPGQELLKKLL